MSQENERTISADTDGVIRHWGQEAERVFGYTREDAVGRKVDLTIPPVLRERHWRGFNKAMETGRMRRPDPNIRLPAIHKNGEVIAFRGTLGLSQADDGTVDGAVATIFGRGPTWEAILWRAVLAALRLGQSLRGRIRSDREQGDDGRLPAVSQKNNHRGARYQLSLPSGRSGRHRSPDERLFATFPGLYRLLAPRMMGLPVGSRLRRLWLTRLAVRALAAANRRDFQVLLLGFHPQIELHGAAALRPPDMNPVIHGHEDYETLWRGMMEAFEDFHGQPVELLDLGDMLLGTVDYKGHGSGSDVPVTMRLFQLFKFERGLVVLQRDFSDRSKALEAAGLRE
jgi:PAS domain S-box-containing protein